jgi:hypothetical protein
LRAFNTEAPQRKEENQCFSDLSAKLVPIAC